MDGTEANDVFQPASHPVDRRTALRQIRFQGWMISWICLTILEAHYFFFWTCLQPSIPSTMWFYANGFHRPLGITAQRSDGWNYISAKVRNQGIFKLLSAPGLRRCGDPRGSVLEPPLFTMSEVSITRSGGHIYSLYADDIQLSVSVAPSMLLSTFMAVKYWVVGWMLVYKLQMNATITKVMLISRKHGRQQVSVSCSHFWIIRRDFIVGVCTWMYSYISNINGLWYLRVLRSPIWKIVYPSPLSQTLTLDTVDIIYSPPYTQITGTANILQRRRFSRKFRNLYSFSVCIICL